MSERPDAPAEERSARASLTTAAAAPAAPTRSSAFTRISGWEIDGFGHFAGEAERELPGGLVVFHGPNEAGKSTLLAYLRAILFGFPHGNSREPAYEPTRGGQHAGRVMLETDRDALVVERVRRRNQLSVTRAGSGEALAEGVLAEALGHADRELYGNVFAFGLGELQSFDSLGSEGVSEKIFSAGIRGAGRSARDALERLRGSMHALFKARARTTEVQKLARQLGELEAQLAERRERAQDYARLAAEEAELAGELKALRERAAEANERERRAGQLLDLWLEVWSPLGDVREALAKLEEIGAFPERAVEQLEILEGRMLAQRDDADEISDERAECGRAAAALVLDDRLLAVAGDVARLAKDRSLRASNRLESDELTRMRDDAEASAVRTLAEELGPQWDEARVLAFDASLARSNEARRWRERLDAAEQPLLAAHTAHEELEREAGRIARRRGEVVERIDALRAPTPDRIRHERVWLRELRSVSSRAEALAPRRVAARERADELRARLDARMPLGAAAFAMAVGVGGFAATRRAPGVFDGLGGADVWVVLALVAFSGGALAALLFGGASGRRLSSALSEREAAVAALDVERAELAAAASERLAALQAVDARTPRVPPASTPGHALPDPASLDALAQAVDERAEQSVAASLLRRSVADLDLEGTRNAEELQRTKQRMAALERARDAELDGWAELRHSLGLPEEIAPDDVGAFADAIRRSREALRRRDATAARLADLNGELEAWYAELREVLRRAGREDASAGDADALRSAFDALVEACDADREARREQAVLEERLQALERRAERSEAKRDRAEAELRALLVAGGAGDANALRARARCVEERSELEGREHRLLRELDRRLGRSERARALREELERGLVDEWREEQTRASDDAEEIEAERDAAVRQHHDLEHELHELERSSAVADLELERETTRQELAEAVREWRRLRVATALVSRTLERFERERQPGVLREASALLQHVSGGRYERVAQSSQGDVFDVVAPGGARKSPGALSRGTAEQLYLCVRLGLIAEFARRSRALPIVMDDVIVNFDDQRADAAAALLARFAAEPGRQLLYFTCSAHTRDRLLAAAPGASVRELSAAPSF